MTIFNHKHRLMSTCLREAALFYPHRSVLMYTETAYFSGKASKNRLVCKMPLQLLIMGVAGSWLWPPAGVLSFYFPSSSLYTCCKVYYFSVLMK